MKDNEIISKIKTAGVVATAAFTMASCGNKLSESQTQIVKHKTDSAAYVHHEYKLATDLAELCELRINNFRRANKDIVKLYARTYIADTIKDLDTKRFMLDMIDDEVFVTQSYSNIVESDSITDNTFNKLSYIRKNQRWFYDLMLYLTDEYNERQFLKSDFFKVVDDARLKSVFERNTQRMEGIQKNFDFALERKTAVYNQLWNKYKNEVKRKR